MANRKNYLGMLVMVLAFGMTVIGCSSGPKYFVKGSPGETSILLRQGLDFDLAFREVAFSLNRHGFESETLQPEVGYIRTRWAKWESNESIDEYRVRVICNFNPSRTQLILKIEAESKERGQWVSGNDTKAIDNLRTDLNNIIGN
jgi:hypothetical protein